MAYNWCWWLRNFFDITVLYCTGDAERIRKMAKLVNMEKYEEGKEYECDIFIRNSVWGVIPKGIKAKRMIEMRHANYKWLLDKGLLWQQYKDMGIEEIVGCGEYVSKMSHEALGDNPTTIKNILLPKKETHKVLHFISCTRIDQYKGWDRIQILAEKLRREKIKFVIDIFTNSRGYKSNYEEIRFWEHRDDIWDYIADADYTLLLSDSEGSPYTVQESLLYKTPCVVTDVGGCTELIKDGVNGYVVPLDMNFDVRKLLNIPKCEEYDNHALEDWLKYLGYKGKINKKEIIEKFEEEENIMVRVKVIKDFSFGAFDSIESTLVRANAKENVRGKLYANDTFECEEDTARYLTGNNPIKEVVVEIVENIKPKEEVNKETPKEEKKELPKQENRKKNKR